MNYTTIHGVKLQTNGDMVVAAAAQRHSGYEPETIAVWRRLITENPRLLFIDIGAYTGLYSIMAAQLGAYAIAFEPNPPVYDRLLQNIRLNEVSNIDLFQIALWSERATLNLSMSFDMSSAASVVRTNRKTMLQVNAIALDDFIDYEYVAAIKIDAERAEPEIIKGALGTIKHNKPALLIEVLDGADEIDGLLCGIGYRGVKLDAGMMLFTVEERV